MRADVFSWYVARARHRQTSRAHEEIREAEFEVLTALKCYPATRARRSVSGSLIRAREEHFAPLFVGYVIVRLNLAEPGWRRIHDMDSVERIISGGHTTNNGIGIPISVPDSAIDRLRKILSPTGVWFPPGYRAPTDDEEPIDVGTPLRLVDGVLAEYDAVCAESDGKRVAMLMGWFNRDNVRTTAAQSAVEVISADAVGMAGHT